MIKVARNVKVFQEENKNIQLPGETTVFFLILENCLKDYL